MSSTTALVTAVTPTTAVAWSTELDGARMLLRSGLAPQSLKTPEAALFVILVGRDLGLSPTQSLRSVNVIQGKVEVAADMQLALFKRAGGKASWARLSESEAVLDLTHPNGDKHRESFTEADARRAGLTGANWSKYPKAMLRSRCITAGMKSCGFDALAGVYDEGEISGVEPVIGAEPTLAPNAAGVPAAEMAPVEQIDHATGEVIEPDADALQLARDYVIGFGFLKGKTIGEVPHDTLRKSLAWAREKGPDKFAAFIHAATTVLDVGYTSPVPGDAPEGSPDVEPEALHHALASADRDDLPF